jgi:hypothetical protein
MAETKTERKKLPPLDLSDAQLSLVGPDVLQARRKTRGSRERTKAQKTLDALVQKAYDKWVKDGRPDDFGKRPGGHVRVPESQLLSVKRAIYSAGKFLNMAIRFGDEILSDGYAEVVFSATDRKPKAE